MSEESYPCRDCIHSEFFEGENARCYCTKNQHPVVDTSSFCNDFERGLRKCPICGGSPSVIQYITSVDDRGWSVGCLRCNVFANDEDKDSAIRVWNEINSRECEHEVLKPCPFCGGPVELRDETDGRDETYAIHCIGCNMHYTKFVWRSYSKENVVKEWNGRAME